MIPENEIPARQLIYRVRLWAMFGAYNFFMWVRPKNIKADWAIDTQPAPRVAFPDYARRPPPLIPVDA